ncbi:MAG: hypothetical protein ACYDDZ_03685 [Acidimicrobiales bacterium]
MLASLWIPILAGASVFVALTLLFGTVLVFLLWRVGRRKWRTFRSHGLVVAASTAWVSARGYRRPRAPLSHPELQKATGRRVRHELSCALEHTEAVVATAAGVGTSTGSLSGLVCQLRGPAEELDRLLRVDPTHTVATELADQVWSVVQAANDIRAAAMAQASDATAERVRQLVRDAHDELVCIDAGLASARSTFPPLAR